MAENSEFNPEYTDEDKKNRSAAAEPVEQDQRELVLREICAASSNDFVLQLPTGFGKCRVAVEIMHSKNITDAILLVIPKLVLIENWKEEFVKWGYADLLPNVTFTTYISLDKHANQKWNAVIFDECHHLSDAAYAVAEGMKWKCSVWLSATMNDRYGLIQKLVGDDRYFKRVSVRQAILNEVLPDPKVYLMRMTLDNTVPDQFIEMNTDVPGEPFVVQYKDRFNYFGKRNVRYKIQCTAFQYVENLNNSISYAHKQFLENPKNMKVKNFWLHLCGQRLNYLSTLKEDVVKFMVGKLADKRVVVFCGSIEQSERLCPNSINSKRKGEAQDVLERFNSGAINHISSCNMLNEGVNLVDCQYGVYAALNSSEVLIKQKLGRLLRHENPILIIPFFVGTREEEIVKDMVQDYSRSLVSLRDAPKIDKE